MPESALGTVREAAPCRVCGAPRTETYIYEPDEIVIGGRYRWKPDDHLAPVSCILYLAEQVGRLREELHLLKSRSEHESYQTANYS
jgi:hypothetical protein